MTDIEMLTRLAEIKLEMKVTSRYPYTYAVDLICDRGFAKNREDASEYMTLNKLDANDIADVFVDVWALRRLADEIAEIAK